MEEFSKFPADIQEAPTRFMEWFNHVTPETEKLPLDWARLDKEPFKKLLVLRCMRPDRLQVALQHFVVDTLPQGKDFVMCDATMNSAGILDNTLSDATATTPIFFILSPGADVVGDVEALAQKYGFEKGASYHNVAMGQGQDVIAMEVLELAHKQGHWVLLNNVHLMPRWLIELEKKLDAFAQEGSHERFRVFLTGEPSSGIPIGMLNRSIKVGDDSSFLAIPGVLFVTYLLRCLLVCNFVVAAAHERAPQWSQGELNSGLLLFFAGVCQRGGAEDACHFVWPVPLPRRSN